MRKEFLRFRFILTIGFLGSYCFLLRASAGKTVLAPTELKCDSLVSPLGIDDEHPIFSWKAEAAESAQTAYRVEVSSEPALLRSGRANMWDSGKVLSSDSLNTVYGGSPLQPETRYYWRVTTWSAQGGPVSAESSWETGLMKSANWTAKWISYLEPDESAVREANSPWIADSSEGESRTGRGEHDFRFSFNVSKPLRQSVLFVTGKDLPSAWMNGKQVMKAGPMPPWKQAPWGTYERHDVTALTHAGQNTLAVAVEIPEGNEGATAGSMSATLILRADDGSVEVLKSGPAWKGKFNAGAGWTADDFRDATWQQAAVTGQTDDVDLGKPWPTGTVKLLRKSFAVNSTVVSARLYVTALGSYEMRLNGKKVGKEILAPGWTDYREHVLYQTYDVTGLIQKGSNAIGAYLAAGWYGTPLMWFRQGNNYGRTPPSLMAQLRLEHKDGSVQWIATDASWKADSSSILQAEIYDGETYDARRVQSGWDTGSFDAGHWKPVLLENPKVPKIESQYFEPIREERVMKAKTVSSPAAGVYVYDFGQNMAAVPRVQFSGPAGTDVRLRFAEVLNTDGTIYTENLRTAKATDHFILAGQGEEQYQPRFTFHGFRYVEVTGVASKPPLDAVKVVVLHTDAPFTLTLDSGSPMINQLWSNVVWGQRSNFLSVPTDCPQRDERLGWAADAQVFWRTATYNMDIAAFSRKFSADLRGTQAGTAMYGIYAPGVTQENPGYGTGWSDAGMVIPWTAWLQYGDKSIARENWDAMAKYLNAIQNENPDFLWTKDFGIAFGDWLAPEQSTSIQLIATAYWAYDVTLMEQMARALGKDEEAKQYEELFGHIRAAFAKAYVQPDGTILGQPAADGKPAQESQTGYVLALNMRLVPDALRMRSADKLVAMLQRNGGRLGTGFLGTPYLLAVLTDTGHSDVAYQLLLNTEYPSWGYVIEHGATTTWERWNGDKMRSDPGMNSYNHYAYGAVADWIYRYAAGIDTVPEDAGFHTVYLHPHFDSRLGKLSVDYQSSYGEIKSSWAVEGSGGSWTVTLPANTIGKLPIEKDRYTLTQVNGVALESSPLLKAAKSDGRGKTYLLAPGNYTFHFEASGEALAVR